MSEQFFIFYTKRNMITSKPQQVFEQFSDEQERDDRKKELFEEGIASLTCLEAFAYRKGA